MTPPDFVHLHVASGFSLRHGASTPQALVERAAEHGQPALALTDRDGLYGAVRFATAAISAGLVPVLGVDLAVAGSSAGTGAGAPGPALDSRKVPVRGGAIVDPRHPRVTVLARGRAAGLSAGAGWAALCRLVTDAHLAGARGTPATTPTLLARCATPELGAARAGQRPRPGPAAASARPGP